MSNEMELHSNQATQKYLGYVYQVLIAIEQCLISKVNQKIYIECYGDIYSQQTGMEIKHHLNTHYLTDNSIDFWKTLKNWITEDISDMKSLILHTTSEIRSDSIFFDWNDLSKKEKYNKLNDHKPVNYINDFYNLVMDKSNKSKLHDILEIMKIKSSQPKIKEKWEELKEHRYFSHIPENNKNDALDSIYGYINRIALEDTRKWIIDINNFDRNKALLLRSFTTDKTLFPFVAKSEVDNTNKGFHFVDELESIKLRPRVIQSSISDYLRSNESCIRLLTKEPYTMMQNLEIFDNELEDEMYSRKDYFIDDIAENIDKQENSNKFIIQQTKKLYFDCINNIRSINISNVNDIQPYYYRGRIHNSVNECTFSWIITSKDIKS